VYKINEQILQDIFGTKLKAVKAAVYLWPHWLKHAEDMALRSAKWREYYKDVHAIMWDNTNINFMGKPTCTDLQRLTYSLYYGGNVVKGGIFLQLCSWLGGWDLWLGAMSDTEYFERSGILESQKEFQEKFDLLSVLHIIIY
jgi:hypothetical protein